MSLCNISGNLCWMFSFWRIKSMTTAYHPVCADGDSFIRYCFYSMVQITNVHLEVVARACLKTLQTGHDKFDHSMLWWIWQAEMRRQAADSVHKRKYWGEKSSVRLCVCEVPELTTPVCVCTGTFKGKHTRLF